MDFKSGQLKVKGGDLAGLGVCGAVSFCGVKEWCTGFVGAWVERFFLGGVFCTPY